LPTPPAPLGGPPLSYGIHLFAYLEREHYEGVFILREPGRQYSHDIHAREPQARAEAIRHSDVHRRELSTFISDLISMDQLQEIAHFPNCYSLYTPLHSSSRCLCDL
jgi:hypothetical protein